MQLLPIRIRANSVPSGTHYGLQKKNHGYDEREDPEDRLRVEKWDEDHGISEKGTTAWCDAREEHFHDDDTSSH